MVLPIFKNCHSASGIGAYQPEENSIFLCQSFGIRLQLQLGFHSGKFTAASIKTGLLFQLFNVIRQSTDAVNKRFHPLVKPWAACFSNGREPVRRRSPDQSPAVTAATLKLREALSEDRAF